MLGFGAGPQFTPIHERPTPFWQQVAFVLTPQAALGDQRPLDQLRAGAVSAVVRVAHRTGTAVGDAAAVPSTA